VSDIPPDKIKFSHRIEYAAVKIFMGFLSPLCVERASAFGGWVGRNIGYPTGISRRARKNLVRAFPEKNADEIEQILKGMWDNLGRTACEYAHLDKFKCYEDNGRITVRNAHLLDVRSDEGKPAIYFSGHLANWEIIPLCLSQRNIEAALVYRAPNNPLTDQMIERLRSENVAPHQIPKGLRGARKIFKLLKQNISMAMLLDQKMNDGIEVPFFGRPAMTAPAAVQLALRQGLPLIPARCKRIGGTRFEIEVFPAIELQNTGDIQADTLAGLSQVNQHLEDWIRDDPKQWLWLHNRWSKES
jgi:KDO2-lipid IV(A) lauroyltransferase